MAVRARYTLLTALSFLMAAVLLWLVDRYDGQPRQSASLKAFTTAEYPDNPENKSRVFGSYPHRHLVIESLGATRFRFLLEPASPQATTIELTDIDLAHFVAAVPPWVKADADLTKVGLIDREWNRQQVRFSRSSSCTGPRGRRRVRTARREPHRSRAQLPERRTVGIAVVHPGAG